MALFLLTLLLAPALSDGLTDTWGGNGASQQNEIPGLDPQRAPTPGKADTQSGLEVKDMLDNAGKGWTDGVANPVKQWAHGIKDKIEGVHKHITDEGTTVAKKVEKAVRNTAPVKRIEAEISKRAKHDSAPPQATAQSGNANKLMNAMKVTATAAQAQQLAAKAGTSVQSAMQGLKVLSAIRNSDMLDEDEEFKQVMNAALESSYQDEAWREDPYKRDEIERLDLQSLPTDAMVDAMWALKAPSDDKILQVWTDVQARAKTAQERKFTTDEVNAWISMVMKRRRAVRKEAILHPEQPPVLSFTKQGHEMVGTVKSIQGSQAMETMFKNQDKLPTPGQLEHLPTDEMVAKMWQMENPTNAAMRQVWKEMLAPTITVQEKELVSREVQDWIKLVMNKRKARKFREQVLAGPV